MGKVHFLKVSASLWVEAGLTFWLDYLPSNRFFGLVLDWIVIKIFCLLSVRSIITGGLLRQTYMMNIRSLDSLRIYLVIIFGHMLLEIADLFLVWHWLNFLANCLSWSDFLMFIITLLGFAIPYIRLSISKFLSELDTLNRVMRRQDTLSIG